MLLNYFRNKREKMFPDIKDFSADQDQYKNTNVNKLDYKTWFWFHPSAFNLFFYGSPFVALFIYLSIGLYAILNHKMWLLGIIIVFMAVLLYDVIKKSKFWEEYENVTFYDFYIKDFKIEEVKKK